jgi:hypothetical protein
MRTAARILPVVQIGNLGYVGGGAHRGLALFPGIP